MGVNTLPKTVTRQRRGCDLNPGPSTPESSMLAKLHRTQTNPLQVTTLTSCYSIAVDIIQIMHGSEYDIEI